jgi:hypothetical protein
MWSAVWDDDDVPREDAVGVGRAHPEKEDVRKEDPTGAKAVTTAGAVAKTATNQTRLRRELRHATIVILPCVSYFNLVDSFCCLARSEVLLDTLSVD